MVVQDRNRLVLAALQGVPALLFFEVADQTGYRREQVAEVFDTSLKTFQRYEREHRKLSPQDSEKVLKMQVLFSRGNDVFGSAEAFRRWMDKPAFGLGGQVPFTLLHTSGGIDLIMDELIRIDYGDLAWRVEVYRITRAIYTDRLVASGGAARWNARGRFVIYSAGSRALACLENVVHRSGEGLQDLFRVMVINVPETVPIDTVSLVELPPDWTDYQNYDICQQQGETWLLRGASPVLRVPSAIVTQEWNYLLNPAHPLFSQIELLRTEAFVFDPRLKAY